MRVVLYKLTGWTTALLQKLCRCYTATLAVTETTQRRSYRDKYVCETLTAWYGYVTVQNTASRNSAVGVTTGWTVRGSIPSNCKGFSLPQMSRPAMGPTQQLWKILMGVLSPTGKGDHFPLRGKIMSRSVPLLPLYVLTARAGKAIKLPLPTCY